MTATWHITVTSDHLLRVTPDPGATLQIAVLSGATVYYGDTLPVNASQNQGSVTAGNSATVTEPVWLFSASQSDVQLTHVDPSAALSALAPSGDTSGVTDTANIQAAINALQGAAYPAQGGTILLKRGTYFLNQQLAITADNVTIAGEGAGNPTGNKNTNSNPQYGGTVLQATSSFSGSWMLKFGQAVVTRTLNGCFLRDLALDGQFLPASVGGVFWQVFKGGMDRVYVYKPTGDGIHQDGNGSISFPSGTWDNHFWNVTVEGAGGDGWAGVWTSDNTYVGCTVKNCTGHGFHMDANSPSNMWTGCYVNTNAGKGFQLDVSMQQKIMATRVQDNNGGIYLVGSNGYGGFQIVGCTIRNPSYTTDNTTDGINLSSSVNTFGGVITGCGFFVDAGNGNGGPANSWNRARYLINIADTGVRNVSIAPYTMASTRTDGIPYGTGPLNELGTNTQIHWAVGQSGLPEIKHSGLQRILWRSGSPAGAVTAGPGSLVLSTGGGAGTTLYVKESATDTTGWVGK